MILICAKEDDGHAVKVANILQSQHEQEVFVFDTSKFPGSVSLTGRFGNGATDLLMLRKDGRQIPLQDITGFWWRRPQPIDVDPRIDDPTVRSFTHQECISSLYGLLQCCDTLWINDIQSDAAAEYKPYQLKVARELGFIVPDTLITNDPDAVLEFRNQHNGNIIYKAFNQRGLVWRPTRVLREEDLALLHNLRHSPVIFQVVVPGIRDVRVTAIGDRLIATEFDIEQMDGLDYRMKMAEIPCRPHELPNELAAKIHAFMSQLGLEYGGIDFRLTPDGQYVFFEINTAGEFTYLEERTGQPIAETMAAHLAAGKPAHPTRKPLT